MSDSEALAAANRLIAELTRQLGAVWETKWVARDGQPTLAKVVGPTVATEHASAFTAAGVRDEDPKSYGSYRT